jgi:CHAT domain-containing protein
LRKDDKYAVLLNNIGYLKKVVGDFEQAEKYFTESTTLLEQEYGRDTIIYADCLSNLAAVHEESGRFEMAEQLHLECINIYKKTGNENHPYFSIHLSNLALVFKKLDKNQKAKELLLQAKSLDSLMYGTDHIYYAITLHNLGDSYIIEGNYDLATKVSSKAYQIVEAAGLDSNPEYLHIGNNLAKLYFKNKDYEKGRLLYEKLIQIGTANAYNYFLSRLLQDVALVYHKHIKEKNPMDYALKAIEVDTRLKLSEDITAQWVDSLNDYNYLTVKKLSSVLRTLETIYSIKESATSIKINELQLISNLALQLLKKIQTNQFAEADKLRVLKKNNFWLLRGISHLEGKQLSEAFRLADYNKSILLLEATKSEKVYHLSNLPDSVIAQKEAYYKEKAQLIVSFSQSPNSLKDSLRRELNQLNISITSFEQEIDKKYPNYKKQKNLTENTKVVDIQTLLDDKTALIEYVISDSMVHIFRVDQKEVVWHQEAVLESILRKNVKQLHQSLSDYQQLSKEKELNYKNYTELAHWFYEKLLAPVLQEGGGIENLIIVTDGELGHLPFESFLVEAAPKDGNYKNLNYLLKDYNISYNYSAMLWKENKQSEKRKNNGQMLAMAARYDEKLDANLLRGRLPTTRQTREVLQPLPAARKEVEVLAALYQGYFAFDSLASEKELKAKASEYAIIHLAMHGLLDEDRPMLSSLALTEDGDSLQDNFWQAHEISKMELNADLVVLSACETGYGRFETGNGIASLARAFMYAGVPSLVVSLWQVNDQSTSIIMQNFYKHLASGQSKSAALRQAKLDYISNADGLGAHPAFWSPFILIGDDAPVKLQRKGGGNWLLWIGIGVGALLLVGLGFGMTRKRTKETA